MARQAEAAGLPVGLVIMIDPISLNARWPFWVLLWSSNVVFRLFYRNSERRNERIGVVMARLWERLRRVDQRSITLGGEPREGDSLKSIARKYAALDQELERRFQTQMEAYFRAMAAYLPRRVNCRLVCLVTQSHQNSFDFDGSVWKRFGSSLKVDVIPGEHMTCITTHVEALAAHMRAALAAQRETN
jgi:thioesterase domain-containing protein